MESSVAEQMELERLKKVILGKILSKEAVERLGRLRAVNNPIVPQLEMYLIQLYQSGQLKETITDEKLKQILSVLTTERKTSIRRM